ncbi:MAG: IS1182 family transposase [Nitrospirae bacterium]|nr:IS1182 family transposase [Nitrospirota bacterium]
MAYRFGDRHQIQLLPITIEDYVTQDDPVRVYDAFVETLDLNELGIIWDDSSVGNSAYNPKSMIKLLVYGYSYGIRSSRKLERATYHNLSFIWLMGKLHPDHKTISNFRKDNRKVIKNILKQCAKLCIRLKLIEGNTLFVDGSKIRANAGIKNTWTTERCEKYLKHIDEHIESILTECETLDKEEDSGTPLAKLNDELSNLKTMKTRVEQVMQEIKEQDKKSINTTDPDCVKVKGRQGIHAGYNGQIVVDQKHGLIVHSDVVMENNDLNQFSEQINMANEIVEQNCKNACADAGYANTDKLKEIHDKGITVIVPSGKQAHNNKTSKPFDKEHFRYDSQNDCYTCPEGHTLTYSHQDNHANHTVYKIQDKTLCATCQHLGICTNARNGRRIKRLQNEETKKQLEDQYTKQENQTIYKQRKDKVELPFGHIKHNLGVSGFLMRGREGVRAELGLLATCFNIARMITIIGYQTSLLI